MIRRFMHVGARGHAHELCNSSSSHKQRERPPPRLLYLFVLSFISFLIVWSSSGPLPFKPKFFLSYSLVLETVENDHPHSSSPNAMIADEKNTEENRGAGTHVETRQNILTSVNSTDEKIPVKITPLGTMICDRSHYKTDICFMKGDIRTHSSSKSIHMYSSKNLQSPGQPTIAVEKIKPYTRKWETSVMSIVQTLSLIQHRDKPKPGQHLCDVYHNAPAVVFSTSGYTGNQFHAFNDGFIPLYITTQHLNRKVVFVIMKYHVWWYLKYKDIISQLTDYPPINFDSDKRTHCFPELIAGLRIHDQLTVDPTQMTTTDHNNKTIHDFSNLLDRAYRPRFNALIKVEKESNNTIQQQRRQQRDKGKPGLVMLSRTGSRSITNEAALVKLAERIGFRVRVVRPKASSELALIYKTLDESEVLVGVLGAAMTYLLFMRPGSLLIQIVPIGTEDPAKKDFEQPAVKMGLKYVKYSVLPKESSLLDRFKEDDPVIKDPDSVGAKGWEFTKMYYLDNQTITLDLERFRKVLVDAYGYASGLKGRSRLVSL